MNPTFSRLARLLLLVLLTCASTLHATNYISIVDLRTLVVIYRGYTNAPPNERINDWELQSIKNAADVNRLFYFRNSGGKLCLTYTYEIIDTPAPDTQGPTYDNIVADLRERGYVNRQYDAIMTTGKNLAGNWGGFMLFDRTGGAMGLPGTGGQLEWFPCPDTNTGYQTAWIFVHELQHAVDLAIAGGINGFLCFLHGHPYDDHHNFDTNMVDIIRNPGGQHWDWIACTLRNFDRWDELVTATGSRIYALDTDGDGLADDHPYLPMDEKRFGSCPYTPDTDGDGLTDLEEFMADIYFGSDPNNPDTNDNGIPDGQDRWPTVPIAPTLNYAYPAPAIDGVLDDVYTPLITRWYACRHQDTTPRDAFKTYAAWHEDALYIYAVAPTSFTYQMQLDSSAENGFWIGGDTYVMEVRHNEMPMITAPKRTEWPGAEAVWTTRDDTTILEMKLPAAVGFRGVTSGHNFPEDTATGLEMLAEKYISFNIGAIMPAIDEHILLTPNWTMVDTLPVKTDDVPPNPILWYTTPAQNTTTPTIVLEGVHDTTPVNIIDEDGAVLGTFTGNGTFTLSEMVPGTSPQDGTHILYAVTDCGVKSDSFALVLDTGALPPAVDMHRSNDVVVVSLSGEPGAQVVIETEIDDAFVPLYSIQLDDNGTAHLPIDPARKGFAATYYATKTFEDPRAYRIDPEIDFAYRDGSPMPGIIPRDLFSIIWRGTLSLPTQTNVVFTLKTDDGSRLYINGERVIDHWGVHEATEMSASVSLDKGTHDLKIYYYENLGWASAHFYWQPEGGERSTRMPVTAPGSSRLRAAQTDPLGNTSEFTEIFCLTDAD